VFPAEVFPAELTPMTCVLFLCATAVEVGLTAFAAPGSAQEPFGRQLLRPDSLIGWEYGRQPIAGWTIADGKLTGSADATPLLSGFSFGDFEIRLHWDARDNAALRLFFPQVPDGKVPEGPGLELTLAENDRCGLLRNGETVLKPGADPRLERGKTHAAVVRRAGDKLSLSVDEKPLWEAVIDARRRFGLGLVVAGGVASVGNLRLEEPPGDPIFDGKTLDGWRCRGNLGAWKVHDGDLVLDGGGGSYIQTEKLYGNFTLSLELQMRKGGNSGIGIRTHRDGWPSGDGMEMQLLDRPLKEANHAESFMGVYGNMPPVARADKSEQYNRIVVKVDGWMLSAWVNGELVQQTNTLDHPELEHRPLSGWIGLQDHGAWIRARDVRVLEAPEGEGLAAWRASPPKRAGAAMIDRVMNPETLTVDDGIRSGAVRVKIEPGQAGGADKKKTEHVLAELAGPGAIVGIAGRSDGGKFQFFFDGEGKPRIECKAGDAGRVGPRFTDGADALPTCLAYRKGLKIVLRDSDSAEYRLDFVTFPSDCAVETYRDSTSGFPRGWLSAARYRTDRFCVSWGGPREYDRLERPTNRLKELAPGETKEVVRVDGAGIVRWWRLLADRKVLDDNDLWLEVTVDGEDSPAVAAPVRFLFPGLAAKGNYNNFVFTAKGAMFHDVLAMPFGKGIAFSLVNRGEKPIQNVGVLLGLQRATDADREAVVARMRLRGAFQPAGDDRQELVQRDGAGRWIGWVYQRPEPKDGAASEPSIEKLVVDGREVPGWSAESLDLLLGRDGDFRASLSGRNEGLCWRYFLLAPVDFEKSLVLVAKEKRLGNRLALFYVERESDK